MTVISKLVASGFKSFAKRTEIQFLPGFNAVIGMNGHGKSNLVDAIGFVLGKSSAKELRAEKSANLIYNGGKNGKPSSQAEVSIFFDNKKNTFPIDTKEVQITRIVKPTGNSVYKVNGDVRTRQQIIDILHAARIDPDGHNIILQGDIIRFIDMKPVERREIIEDVAGISVFEEKKQKALNELEKVGEKLNEANIILTEREKTLKDLKKDRDQAREYKDTEQIIEQNKATRVHLLLKEKTDILSNVEKQFFSLEEEITKQQKEVALLKTDIQDKRKEIDAINKELNERGDKRQRELAQEIEDLKTTIIKDSSRKDVCENELKKLKERRQSLEASTRDLEKKISELKQTQNTLRKEGEEHKTKEQKLLKDIQKYKEDHGITSKDGITKQIEELEKEIEQQERDILHLQEERHLIIRQKDKVEFELQALTKEIKERHENEKEFREKNDLLKKKRDEFKTLSKTLSNHLNENTILAAQLGSARKKWLDANDEYARLRSRNISIQEAGAGDIALRKILSAHISGVYGSIRDLGRAPEQFSLALEIAAGQRIRSVVVSTEEVAAKCIEILKESKTGVLTFLPLTKLQEQSTAKEIAKQEGVFGLAIDLISFDKKFSKAFNYVFGRTLVVKDLSVARRIGVGKARMVTLEGDLLELSGAMIGGYRRRTDGLGFQQKEIGERLEKSEKELQRLQETIKQLEDRKTGNDEQSISLREQKALLEVEIYRLEKSVENEGDKGNIDQQWKEFEKQRKELEEKITKNQKDEEKIEAIVTAKKVQRQTILEKFTHMTDAETGKELETLEKQRQELKERTIKIESETAFHNNEIALYTDEKEKIVQILRENEKDNESFGKELKELIEDLKQNKEVVHTKEENQKKFYAEYRTFFNKRQGCEEIIQKKDVQVIRIEERLHTTEGKRNDIAIKKALIGGEVEGLKKELEAYENISIRRNISLQDIESEIKQMENTLRSLGNVNLRALEIYEKVNEEYQSLVEKFDRLNVEKEDILKMMEEIESKKQDTFMKTFKLLLRNFKEIFSSLSEKGEAELVIENPESVFEAGIEIRVCLHGSRYLDIRALSGGEKTLAALAFLFAIQEFEPSWFYLLDEVDAALDKKNSELLSRLIAKYSKGSQYIVISHNDALITEAETVYGVAMQDGISKVVSLKMNGLS